MQRQHILLITSPILLISLLLFLSLARPQCQFQNMERLEVHVTNRLIYPLIPVEGGTFMMGATSEQGSEADSDEKPAHRVAVGNFFIGETEVTQGLWYDVMGTNPSYFQGSKSSFSSRWRELPVENVSWDDCQEFINRLNNRRNEMDLGDYPHWKFRLPTEAEWEYAARGGSKSRGYKYSGSNNINDVAWYWENSGQQYGLSQRGGYWDKKQPHPVGMKRVNELGIYDMSGNVWEWCQDWYSSSYYGSSPTTNPCNTQSASWRVLRGGSWYEDRARYCRVANRNYCNPVIRDNSVGLRLVLAP